MAKKAKKTGRESDLQASVQALNRLRSDLNQKKVLGYTWRQIGALYGVSAGLIYHIAINGHEPKTPHNRHLLGLPVFLPAPACPTCGKVHTRNCARPNLWRDMSITRVRWALDHRTDF
jgi:hypothetical protein